MSSYRILQGHVLERLAELPDNSVHCVVTSPPYWGLRDYGCAGQIGLEATPAEFLAKMVEVFREVRRVLRADGTCWVNMGDAYAGSWGAQSRGNTTGEVMSNLTGSSPLSARQMGAAQLGMAGTGSIKRTPGLKPKDLIGMPWRLAFALQEDGWWLRQDIIWSKPNPMPESVTDRCTKAHEYVFLLTKSAKYFYDAEAIKETCTEDNYRGSSFTRDKTLEPRETPGKTVGRGERQEITTRNKRSVWEIATEAFPEAHFATFPTKLVEPCILAGTSEWGCCEACGAPWVRVTEKAVAFARGSGRSGRAPEGKHAGGAQESSGDYDIRMGPMVSTRTTGWKAGCKCEAGVKPCVVMDNFSGAGTTGLVALRLGREYIGLELKPEYCAMQERRLREDAPLFRAPAALQLSTDVNQQLPLQTGLDIAEEVCAAA